MYLHFDVFDMNYIVFMKAKIIPSKCFVFFFLHVKYIVKIKKIVFSLHPYILSLICIDRGKILKYNFKLNTSLNEHITRTRIWVTLYTKKYIRSLQSRHCKEMQITQSTKIKKKKLNLTLEA